MRENESEREREREGIRKDGETEFATKYAQ